MKTSLPFRYWLPGLFWAVLIFVLSVRPGNVFPPFLILDILPVDKAGHFACYAILSILFMPVARSQYEGRWGRYMTYSGLVLAGTLYGAGIELVQMSPLVDRTFDVYDILADFLGCFSGIFVFMMLFPAKPKPVA